MRKKSGLKVGEVARRFRVRTYTVYRWETGGAPITAVNLEKMARMFNCTTIELGLER